MLPARELVVPGTILDGLSSSVAIASADPRYPERAPFSPSTAWPEYRRVFGAAAAETNATYAAVRNSLALLGLDAGRFGSDSWNPLSGYVRPGDTVVLKPNFVRNFRDSSADNADCVITHGSVIRVVLDYTYLALQGTGRIIIADAPQNDANFDAIVREAALDVIVDFYARTVGFHVEVRDLRPEAAVKIDGVIVDHLPLPGDPCGYTVVDLGNASMFAQIGNACERLYGAEYDRAEVVEHHSAGRHEYLISNTILQADCVISIPKLKTHKKTGLTGNLKNLVGINGNKNWLPHHREGTPAQGGDQFAEDTALRRLERSAVAQFKRWFPVLGPLRGAVAGPAKAFGRSIFGDTNVDTIRSGNWFGNDTTWRMVIDLNRILAYAARDGRIHSEPVRRYFGVVDGIVIGEGNGPLNPEPRRAGLILAGANPVAVDLVCARTMGFDYRRIPMLHRALEPHPLPLAEFGADAVTCRSEAAPLLAVKPHFGWTGHIELPAEAQ